MHMYGTFEMSKNITVMSNQTVGTFLEFVCYWYRYYSIVRVELNVLLVAASVA